MQNWVWNYVYDYWCKSHPSNISTDISLFACQALRHTQLASDERGLNVPFGPLSFVQKSKNKDNQIRHIWIHISNKNKYVFHPSSISTNILLFAGKSLQHTQPASDERKLNVPFGPLTFVQGAKNKDNRIRHIWIHISNKNKYVSHSIYCSSKGFWTYRPFF